MLKVEQGNFNHLEAPALLVRHVTLLHSMHLDSIIYNRAAMTSGSKSYFIKTGFDVWKGISEKEAKKQAERAKNSHMTLVPDSSIEPDYYTTFPSINILMPVWVFYKS